MKRLMIFAVLAAQILTACGQSNVGTSAGSAETGHDTAWYAGKIKEVNDEGNRLVAEYQSLVSGGVTPGKNTRIEQIYASVDSLANVQKNLVLEITRNFKDSKFPARYLSGDILYAFSYDELKEICDPKTGYYNEPEMQMAKMMYVSLKKRHPGLMYKNLAMPDLSGKTVRLSDWVGKGKYVLVDFWASWCGPCRQEMPNVVAAYSKFKGKNFEIVGVSFDRDKAAWTAAVKQMNMTWPQMSDLKYWNSAAVDTYGINSIPSNILVDPQGKIVAIDLRGEDLQTTLSEFIKD